MILSIQPVPSRHGVHWPQLSWLKNWQMLCSTSTMLVWSSMTVTAAVPRPRQPTLPGPLKSSGMSYSVLPSLSLSFALQSTKPMLTPAGVDRLRLAALPHAAAVLLDQLADGHAHRQLDAARLVDVPGERVELRPVAAGVARVLRVGRHAERLEPVDSPAS